MDYDTILNHLGGFGKYQKRMLVLLVIPAFLEPFTSNLLTFTVGDHPYRCKLPDDNEDFYGNINRTGSWNVSECYVTGNGSTEACREWVYDTSQYESSLISTFDMVCDRRFVRSHMMLSHYIGIFVGSLLCGLVCDTFGRRPTLCISIVVMFLANLTRSWSYSVPLCGFLLVINGASSLMLYQSNYVIATELVGPSKRLFTNFLLYLSYCFGEMTLLAFAFVFRDWRELGWATSVPVGIGCLVPFFISESPRWLLAKGKEKRAMSIFKKMEKENKSMLDADLSKIKVSKSSDVSFVKALKKILKSKTLLFRGALLSFNWFAVNMVYYGISFKVGNLGGSVYINYLISTSAEIVAMFVCLFFNERAGRKKTFIVSMVICGIACLSTIFTSLFGGKDLHWMTIGLAMIGKLFISTGFFTVYLMTAENFPTVLRSTALGICSACGRIGSMVSAYVGDLGVLLDTRLGVALPLTIFGAIGLASGILSVLLPETSDINLPQFVKDAEKIQSNIRIHNDTKEEQSENEKCLPEKLDTKI